MKKQRSLSDPITLRLPQEVLQQIEEIATLCHRSRSWIMVRALKTYLATEAQEMRVIHAAKAGIESGRYFELDDVLAEADAIIKAKLLEAAAALRTDRGIYPFGDEASKSA